MYNNRKENVMENLKFIKYDKDEGCCALCCLDNLDDCSFVDCINPNGYFIYSDEVDTCDHCPKCGHKLSKIKQP